MTTVYERADRIVTERERQKATRVISSQGIVTKDRDGQVGVRATPAELKKLRRA